MPGCASSEKVAHSGPEIIFTLFSFRYGISCTSNANGPAACYHVAVAGFWSASFEGRHKSGAERGRLLNWRVSAEGSQTRFQRRKENLYGSDQGQH